MNSGPQWRAIWPDGFESSHDYAPDHPKIMLASEGNKFRHGGEGKLQRRESEDAEWSDVTKPN